MLRIPKARVDLTALKPYFGGRHAACIKSAGAHILVDLVSDTEEYGYDEQSQAPLSALSPMRVELMRGDLRSAYLAWPLAVSADDLEEDAAEPPVPAGLAELTATQEALVEFLRIDVDLLSAATRASAALPKDDAPFRRWLAALPSKDKDAWLRRAADDPGLGLGGELLRAFRAAKTAEPPSRRRTVSELRALAETQRAEREKAEAQRASKTKARADAARQRHLTQVARDVDGVWSKLEEALRGITQAPITSPGILRPVDRGVIGDNGTATVYAMMPSALKLFAEGRLPRVDGDPVEVIIGGQNL